MSISLGEAVVAMQRRPSYLSLWPLRCGSLWCQLPPATPGTGTHPDRAGGDASGPRHGPPATRWPVAAYARPPARSAARHPSSRPLGALLAPSEPGSPAAAALPGPQRCQRALARSAGPRSPVVPPSLGTEGANCDPTDLLGKHQQYKQGSEQNGQPCRHWK